MELPQTLPGAFGEILLLLITLAAAIKALPVIGRGLKSFASALWRATRVFARTLRLAVKVPHMLAQLVDGNRLDRIELGTHQSTEAAMRAERAATDAVELWRDAAPTFARRLGVVEERLDDHDRRVSRLEQGAPS